MSNTLSRYKSILLAATLGVSMAVGAFAVICYYEKLQLEEQFNSTFSDKTTGLTKAVVAIEKVLIATQQIMAISPNLSAQNFSQLVNEKLLSGTSIKGIEWAPVVLTENQSEFEAKIQQSGIFDFAIREMGSEQTCERQPDKIFPITYAEPSEHLGHELGLNISTDCELRSSMELAVKQNRIVASQFENDSGEVGLRLLLPVENKQQVTGYVIGLVMINELVDSLWGELTQSANYRLTIHADPNKTEKLYDSHWLTDCSSDCDTENYEFSKSTDIPFANQLWYISFNQLKLQGRDDYYAYLAAFLVMLVTATLSYYLYNNINRMQWANKLVEERTASLKFQATHDQLTSLLNKTSLFAHLNTFSENCANSKFTPFSILFIDLDHFKKINDTMGHLVGDQILQLVSQRIKANSRAKDLLFRFGGDEFVILLQDLSGQKQVVTIAERYLEDLKKPYHIQEQSYQIGASIGASIIDVAGTNSEDILRNADIAMYSAKESGRGQVVFFRNQMYDQVMHQHKLESDLNIAIEQEQFILHYQPIFDNHRNLRGFEALARWQHKSKGLIMPFEFVPLIESSNRVKPFGELVAQKAIKKLKELYIASGKSVSNCPYISINISPLQLLDDDIVKVVEQLLMRYQVPGHLLAIELTESALIENHEIVNRHLAQFNRLGVQIYLDDFGTGYSSLSLLQHFPIDTLKIDRSFISALNDETEEAENLVTAIIGMANALNMKVIAEGIEYVHIMSKLNNYGCTGFQGYYFSKPMPEQDVLQYISSLSPLTRVSYWNSEAAQH